ncbi:MAG: ATP-binding protein [Euryarchaeota archaeon]|nr:ATP-binding protein [Euryarchaeota archaeon]
MQQLIERRFIDRDSEMVFLEDRYAAASPEFLVIYGRHRIGKTRLLLNFSQNKPGIYFLCTKDSERENINQMKKKMSVFLRMPTFERLEVNNWIELFKCFFFEFYNRDERIIFILDEFPYLIELNRGVTSVFQKIWDENLSGRDVMLILTGSSVGMIETEVLGYRSPLYGRRTGQWKVIEIDFKYLDKFLPEYNTEDLCMVYGVVGGVPAYLEKFDGSLTFFENIMERMLKKGEFLNLEPEFLLREEFREPKNYFLILKAIARGYNALARVSTYTGLEKGNTSKYLHVLEDTRILRHILPIGRRKRGIYVIEDPLFAFWFRFLYPNRDDVEAENYEALLSKIKNDFPAYMGFRFEFLCEELIRKNQIPLPIIPTSIGKWWHKEAEIDIIALNEKTDEIFFCEVKWKNLLKHETEKVLESLVAKAGLMEWRKRNRKEYYGIIARKIAGKEEFRDHGYVAYDLEDMR